MVEDNRAYDQKMQKLSLIVLHDELSERGIGNQYNPDTVEKLEAYQR